jgi:hypothetical protein
VHLDLRELHELADEEVDVDAGAPVDVGWVLAGEDADAHTMIVDVRAVGSSRRCPMVELLLEERAGGVVGEFVREVRSATLAWSVLEGVESFGDE